MSIVAISLVFLRCQKFVQPENEQQESKSGDDESHYFGNNCMNCHYTEGQGEGWFSIAGSIEGNINNALVHLYTDTTQNAIKTLEIDGLGNFFSTDAFDFSGGVNVGIEDPSGAIKFMPDKIFNGQCNLCHGVTTNKLSL